MSYNVLADKNEIPELMLKYNLALEILETQLNVLIKEFEFKNKCNPVEHIKSRIKTEASALEKLERKGYEVTAENLKLNIHDMIGVRIVCSFISDVYDIVKIIKNSKQFKIKSEKDYIEKRPHPTDGRAWVLSLTERYKENSLFMDQKRLQKTYL